MKSNRLTNYLDYLPKPLLDDIVENRCIPIIGAGFSRNATVEGGQLMPLWEDIAKLFGKQLGEDYTFKHALDPVSDFCHLFGKAKTVEQIREALFTGKVTPGEAHLAFADLPFNTVITTNFDFLLELSYQQKGRRIIPILDEDQLSSSDIGIPRGDNENSNVIILKIHGDVNHPKKMVITESEYDSFVKDHPLMSACILYLLITKTPLFIGYSLDDPDFRSIWHIVRTSLGNLHRHAYSLNVKPKKSNEVKFQRRGMHVIYLGA